MSRRAKLSAVIAVIVLAALTGALSFPYLRTIEFPDERLDRAIKGALGRSIGDSRPIRAAHVRRLRLFSHQFGYNRTPAPDLRGLERCKNLETLDLSSSGIEEIALLGNLTKLRSLVLYSNRIADIRPLGQLRKLRELDLDRNRIKDLTPLKKLRGLRDIRLSENPIDDLTALSGLPELRRLVLGKNRVADLTPLRDLKQLQVLRLDHNEIADLRPLAGLTNLVCMTASSNRVSDLAPLAGLTNLNVLQLDGNKIQDIAALAGLNGIGKTYGGETDRRVTPGTRESVLVHLGLANNDIRDIGALVNYVGLEKGAGVDLRGNPLNDAAYEKHIPALQTIGVKVLYDPRAGAEK